MSAKIIPSFFLQLQNLDCIQASDIIHTPDNFWTIHKSLSDLLVQKDILDFPDPQGERLACKHFFDDWFLYAVPNDTDYTYSLLKLREQEHDAKDGAPADGDTPGVTISFVPMDCDILLCCLGSPTDENRAQLNREINRVVAHRGQRHHNALKQYFVDPQSQGAYLVASMYTKRIASFAKRGHLPLPEHYKQILQRSISYKNSDKLARLPSFVQSLNQAAGCTICDDENIYIADPDAPNAFEAAAILATHTGNTSVYSFAAEVEYHARFLTPLAKVKIPFFGKSIYDSAIRADMTVGDTEFEGPAPFHQPDSSIVSRQYDLHHQDVLRDLAML